MPNKKTDDWVLEEHSTMNDFVRYPIECPKEEVVAMVLEKLDSEYREKPLLVGAFRSLTLKLFSRSETEATSV